MLKEGKTVIPNVGSYLAVTHKQISTPNTSKILWNIESTLIQRRINYGCAHGGQERERERERAGERGAGFETSI